MPAAAIMKLEGLATPTLPAATARHLPPQGKAPGSSDVAVLQHVHASMGHGLARGSLSSKGCGQEDLVTRALVIRGPGKVGNILSWWAQAASLLILRMDVKASLGTSTLPNICGSTQHVTISTDQNVGALGRCAEECVLLPVDEAQLQRGSLVPFSEKD